jgi:hypothetical protein
VTGSRNLLPLTDSKSSIDGIGDRPTGIAVGWPVLLRTARQELVLRLVPA